MKRLFALAVMLTAMAPTGCAENKESERNAMAPGHVALNAAATRSTRASTNYAADIRSSPAGFRVFASAADAPDTWYDGGEGQVIDGSNNHLCRTDKWTFDTPVKWPASNAAYPMTFYAMFPAMPATMVMDTPQTPANLKGTYTIEAAAAEQIDLLAAKAASPSHKPAHDMLDISFDHILSKVNFGMKVAAGYNAHVQSIVVNNVADSRVYDFLAEDWTPESQPTAEVCVKKYVYFADTPKQFVGNGANAPFFTEPEAASANLMLMPQNVAGQTWVPAGDLPGTKSYVRVAYRLRRTTDPVETDYTGYANASSHPDYEGSTTKARDYDGALFVVVGYPYTLEWAKGKGYVYNISLPGSSGGVLLEQNYFDEDGNETDLPVRNLEPGDPLVGDGYIHLIPTVEDWPTDEDIRLN